MNTLSILSDAKYFEDNSTPTPEELRRLLDSKKESEKLTALKHLHAMLSLDRDVSEFFPDVVKNIIVETNEIKTLVYTFIVRYAEANQDLALLSINSLRKCMQSSNARVRAHALRALSNIRVPIISHLILLALKSGVKDSNPYVRKTASHAIPKLLVIDPGSRSDLLPLIEILLGDSEPSVLESALFATQEVFPDKFDIFHLHYRKYCSLLADFSHWGQIICVNYLLRYARAHFQQCYSEEEDKDIYNYKEEEKIFESTESEEKKKNDFYDFISNEIETKESKSKPQPQKKNKNISISDLHPDHLKLLSCCKALLRSMNSGVVIAASQIFYYCAPLSEANKVIGRPLVHMLNSSLEIRYSILSNIASISQKRPTLFVPYCESFFIIPSDNISCRELKLLILPNLVLVKTANSILSEITIYLRDFDKRLVIAAIQAYIRCAFKLTEIEEKCLKDLVILTKQSSEIVTSSALIAIRQLLQKSSRTYPKIIKKTVKMIDSVKTPSARASIVWLIAEYRNMIPKYAPDCLRLLAKGFINESPQVKLQILSLAVKLILSKMDGVSLDLVNYIFDLCKYDQSYDLRDRARFFRQFISTPESPLKTKLTTILTNSTISSDMQDRSLKSKDNFTYGTLSYLIGHTVPNYESLPPYPEVLPNPERGPLVDVTSPSLASVKSDRQPVLQPPTVENIIMNVEDFYSDEDKMNDKNKNDEIGDLFSSEDEKSESEDSDNVSDNDSDNVSDNDSDNDNQQNQNWDPLST